MQSHPFAVKASPGINDLHARLDFEVSHFSAELRELGLRKKPLLWMPTWTHISKLQNSLQDACKDQSKVEQLTERMFDDFSVLRSKYVSAVTSIDEAKTQATAFSRARSIDFYDVEMRKLDPESLALQTKIRHEVRVVEASLESLAEYLDELDSPGYTPSKSLSTGHSIGKSISSPPTVIDVSVANIQ